MMGMASRPPRPPTGPSAYTMGKPNPMAGFQGGGGGFINPGARQFGGSYGTGQLGPMGPQGPQGGAQGPPPGWQGGQATPMMGQLVGGMNDAMMHPFAPRNRGAQAIGPNFTLPQGGGGGQMLSGLPDWVSGGGQGVGPNMIQPALHEMQQRFGANQANVQGQMRRFPGALQRGILQGMQQPAPPPAAPAPYGGQQFRMW
jgi:hypothetical protein